MVNVCKIYLLACLLFVAGLPLSGQSNIERLLNKTEVDQLNNLYYKLYSRTLKRERGQESVTKEELHFVNIFNFEYTGNYTVDSICSSLLFHLKPIKSKRRFTVSMLPIGRLKFKTIITLPKFGTQREYLSSAETFILDKNNKVLAIGERLHTIYLEPINKYYQFLADMIKNQNVVIFSVYWHGIRDLNYFFVIDQYGTINVIQFDVLLGEEQDSFTPNIYTLKEYVTSDDFFLRLIGP